MSSEKKKQSGFLTGVKDVAAGSVGGVLQCLVGHPLDTVKVRLQTSNRFAGMGDCLKTTLKEEGFVGLYKGVQSPLIGLTFFNAIQFLAYGQAKSLVSRGDPAPMTVGQYVAAGSIVGLIVSFVESPIDFLKSQLQTQYSGPQQKYNGFVDCARKIATQGGVRGVYQGLSATIIRDVPANAAYFGAYEIVRKILRSPTESLENMAGWKILASGSVAGVVYWVSIFPLDVIKSSIQTDATERSQRKYKGWLDCARQIYINQGPKAFFKGFTPCIIRAAPANAVCFYGYETARRFLN